MPPDGTGPGRYHLQGEIARGGMGAILQGLDVDLGRELAIKVLLESHRGNPQITRRFVEEAQIGGQLQHPGIVPVYDLGTFADRRPFFAMKLVKGRTLASLLAERSQYLLHREKVPAGRMRCTDESQVPSAVMTASVRVRRARGGDRRATDCLEAWSRSPPSPGGLPGLRPKAAEILKCR